MKILWLKTELLHPVDKGGKIRTYHLLKQPPEQSRSLAAALTTLVPMSRVTPERRERLVTDLRTLGAEPKPGTAEAFGLFIRSESAKWAKVVAEAGIKPE